MLDALTAWPSASAARLLPPMIIDSFAGGGGASTGIEAALGRSPDVAINHSTAALALHAANHPETLHLDSNIWDVAPREIAKGRRVGLLWASPDCKHFSKAKGGAPRDRNIRDLAWVVVRWAEEVQPDVICMENVEEFLTWGPVGEDGQPVKWLAGQTFDDWKRRLRGAGYKLQHRELRACDYGAPTIRKRFFLVARRDGRPIRWPKPTHGDPKSPAVQKGKLLPWRAAAECIDWSLPCPSIFDTQAEVMARHGLRAIRPLADNTLARVARGMKRYVLEAEQPFLVQLQSTARSARALTAPHPTVLTSGGHSALVAPSITRFNSGATGCDLRDPLPTVTANSWIKRPGGAAPLGLLAPVLTHLYTSNTGGGEGAPTKPLKTVTAGGQHHAMFAPVLTYAQQGGGNRPMTAPHHTICASRKDQNALIAPSLVSVAHGDSGGRREYPLTDPYGVVLAGGVSHAMIAPLLVQSGYGERQGQAPRALDIGAPLGTVVAGGVKHALAAPFLAQQNSARQGHNPGRPADAPLSTVTQTGSQQGVVAPWFAKYYGTGDGARSDDPCHTVTVKDRMGHVQAALEAPPFTEAHAARAREVAAFLRAHDAWHGGEFVTLTIAGAEFVVVDIGMRMLTPRELFTAQGFPSDYVIEGVWQDQDTDTPVFKPFPKDVQVSCCGNSVCPPLAEAIIRANCGHLAVTTDQIRRSA